MFNMDVWDVVIFLVAGYVAVITLARMMRRHRDRLMRELRQQLELEKRKPRSDVGDVAASEIPHRSAA